MPIAPREGYEQLGGVPWLARMVDKARLEAEGTIAQLDLEYPCPMDQGLLSQLGLSGNEFQQLVMEAGNDEEIISELRKRNALPIKALYKYPSPPKYRQFPTRN